MIHKPRLSFRRLGVYVGLGGALGLAAYVLGLFAAIAAPSPAQPGTSDPEFGVVSFRSGEFPAALWITPGRHLVLLDTAMPDTFEISAHYRLKETPSGRVWERFTDRTRAEPGQPFEATPFPTTEAISNRVLREKLLAADLPSLVGGVLIVVGWPFRAHWGIAADDWRVSAWVPSFSPRIQLNYRIPTTPIYPGSESVLPIPLGVLWLPLGANLLTWWAGCSVALFSANATRRSALGWFRVRRGRCRKCGYSLRGLDTPRCPECGDAANRPRGTGGRGAASSQ